MRSRTVWRKTSLNARFRQWLRRHVGWEPLHEDYRRLMKQLRGVDAGRKFTRDEMNSR